METAGPGARAAVFAWLLLKSLLIGVIVAAMFGIAWGSVAASVEHGFRAGMTTLPIAVLMVLVSVLWLTRAARGRLLLALGKVRPRLANAVVFVLLWGGIYGAATYVVQHSLFLSLLAAASMAVMTLGVPWGFWRLFRAELRKAGLPAGQAR
ncbi:MAG TPA: hypothetical protein VHL78_07115 [Actinomycetota bacterium]|nr:hypothetical protein [Actinomycetota bacterium]